MRRRVPGAAFQAKVVQSAFSSVAQQPGTAPATFAALCVALASVPADAPLAKGLLAHPLAGEARAQVVSCALDTVLGALGGDAIQPSGQPYPGAVTAVNNAAASALPSSLCCHALGVDPEVAHLTHCLAPVVLSSGVVVLCCARLNDAGVCVDAAMVHSEGGQPSRSARCFGPFHGASQSQVAGATTHVQLFSSDFLAFCALSPPGGSVSAALSDLTTFHASRAVDTNQSRRLTSVLVRSVAIALAKLRYLLPSGLVGSSPSTAPSWASRRAITFAQLAVEPAGALVTILKECLGLDRAMAPATAGVLRLTSAGEPAGQGPDDDEWAPTS